MPKFGLSRRLRKNLRHAWTIATERLRGLDFTAFEESPAGQEGVIYPYERSSTKLLLPMLRRTPREEGDAFLDIGCGKGYVLAFVEKSGLFNRADGIEISGRLCEIARRNLVRLGCRAEVRQTSAEDFADYDRYTFFYMFNPCAPQMVARIESALAASLRRTPRRAHLFYSHPESTASWEAWSESVEQDEARIDGYPHRLVHFTLSAAKAAVRAPEGTDAP